MMNCWQNEPGARPSFTDLTKQLKDMENQHKVRLSLSSDIKRISVTSAECHDNNIICSAINHFEVAQEAGFTMHFDKNLHLVSRPTARWPIGLIISC